MNTSSLALFALIAGLNIVSPGPAILLSITNAVAYGLRSAFASSLGNVAGLICLSAAVTFGVSSLLSVYPFLFWILKVVGASYLIYMGLSKMRSVANVFDGKVSLQGTPGFRQLFRGGFFLAVTNPKPLLFFAAIYPQFVDSQKPLLPQFLVLNATFMGISLASLLSYAAAGVVAKDWLAQGSRVAWFNRLSGLAFVLLGFSMLLLKMR
jgi:homoserine/homoserine lactone efflux protein